MLRSATALKALLQKEKKLMSRFQRGRNYLLDNKQDVENPLIEIGEFLAFWSRGLRLFKA